LLDLEDSKHDELGNVSGREEIDTKSSFSSISMVNRQIKHTKTLPIANMFQKEMESQNNHDTVSFSQLLASLLEAPTESPSETPSLAPSELPTDEPYVAIFSPTSNPTTFNNHHPLSISPTSNPSFVPSFIPSSRPSSLVVVPSSFPTSSTPTSAPSEQISSPSNSPTLYFLPPVSPTSRPSSHPVGDPSGRPTLLPVPKPSSCPSSHPAALPSACPLSRPSGHPSSSNPVSHPTAPSSLPSSRPVSHPTAPSSLPSSRPVSHPTAPSSHPSSRPVSHPTAEIAYHPSANPSSQPSLLSNFQPSSYPLSQPTKHPICVPVSEPTSLPSKLKLESQPSAFPSGHPFFPTGNPTISTNSPTSIPTISQFGSTEEPSNDPSVFPSSFPSAIPSLLPVSKPTVSPSANPVSLPSPIPSFQPSSQPSSHPSSQPSLHVTSHPTLHTLIPTHSPTRMPSLSNAPTVSGFVSPIVSFTSNVTLKGLTNPALSRKDKQAVINTTADSMNISPQYVYIKSYTAVPSSSNSSATIHRLLRRRLTITYTFIVTTGTNVPIAVYGVTNATAFYNQLVAALSTAVSTGQYTTTLQLISQILGANNTANAVASNVTSSAPVVLIIPPEPTTGATDSADDSSFDWSSGVIIGISIGGAAFLAIVVGGLHVYYYRYFRPVPKRIGGKKETGGSKKNNLHQSADLMDFYPNKSRDLEEVHLDDDEFMVDVGLVSASNRTSGTIAEGSPSKKAVTRQASSPFRFEGINPLASPSRAGSYKVKTEGDPTSPGDAIIKEEKSDENVSANDDETQMKWSVEENLPIDTDDNEGEKELYSLDEIDLFYDATKRSSTIEIRNAEGDLEVIDDDDNASLWSNQSIIGSEVEEEEVDPAGKSNQNRLISEEEIKLQNSFSVDRSDLTMRMMNEEEDDFEIGKKKQITSTPQKWKMEETEHLANVELGHDNADEISFTVLSTNGLSGNSEEKKKVEFIPSPPPSHLKSKSFVRRTVSIEEELEEIILKEDIDPMNSIDTNDPYDNEGLSTKKSALNMKLKSDEEMRKLKVNDTRMVTKVTDLKMGQSGDDDKFQLDLDGEIGEDSIRPFSPARSISQRGFFTPSMKPDSSPSRKVSWQNILINPFRSPLSPLRQSSSSFYEDTTIKENEEEEERETLRVLLPSSADNQSQPQVSQDPQQQEVIPAEENRFVMVDDNDLRKF
jgi:hypothetical protein